MEKTKRLAAKFWALFAFWLILSGKLEVKYLIFGVLSAALVTFITQDLLEREERRRKAALDMTAGLKSASRLVLYFVWLLREVVISNCRQHASSYIPSCPSIPACYGSEHGCKAESAIFSWRIR
jgi:multisubunit Na+/H+ antiporter MnhE subunit